VPVTRGLRRRTRWLSAARGATLIELVTSLAVMAVVVASLYLLLGAGIKGRLIVHARVSDQERGRHALTWIADRLRQAGYDPQAACPDGLVRAGSGQGFEQRLAFRATVDDAMTPPRRLYVYYAEGGTLWEEVWIDGAETACFEEVGRVAPDRARVAVTSRIVRGFSLTYFDRDGAPAQDLARVRSVGMTLRLESESTPGRLETQVYRTLVTIRGL
jgi:hypothetical protein